ncbi:MULTISPECIES: helix-turn-helix transcriptional regulator [Pseudoalteromonas]|uniref:HTH araC/xylS-type domain-containing protein n=1 Tax=Pseudoalteromonas amylolytica TaxID=1859457 RepID=A0A1S1N0G9_9GAMM|nr:MULTISPECIES: helix-turn-helix domain-containing protein [Pseudoalteromonas]OHU88086.1 hypothetical protein BFC16_11890 [Pseudoalteromonas sp. JW3]OHU91526.1 hypothetical protein BET10_12010 [Pseudoalteromonas amylolytica]
MNRYFEAHERVFKAHTLILPLVEMAMQRGVSADLLLKGSKLFFEDFKTHSQLISCAQLDVVFSNASKLLAKDGVSFLLGERLSHTASGNGLQALLHAKSLHHMYRISQLRQFELFPYMYTKNFRTQTHTHFILNFAVHKPSTQVTTFFYELVASLIERVLKQRLGMLATQRLDAFDYCIQFPFPEPSYIEQFHSNLCGSYSFSHQSFVIAISNKLLNQPLADAMPTLAKYYLCQNDHIAHRVGFLQFVTTLISKFPRATSDQLAHKMGYSCATFKRKLKQHQTSFKELKDELQKQQSLFNITELGYSNEQAAAALSFSDTTNFRRAFKRWTGKTPSEYRHIWSR